MKPLPNSMMTCSDLVAVPLIDCEGESIFLIFVLLVTVFLNIIALIRARSYSVSAKKRNKFLCFALDFS